MTLMHDHDHGKRSVAIGQIIRQACYFWLLCPDQPYEQMETA